MLVITIAPGEFFSVGDALIKIERHTRHSVRLHIFADRSSPVHRFDRNLSLQSKNAPAEGLAHAAAIAAKFHTHRKSQGAAIREAV
ncbi:MAG TPA: hypothetical protein VHQ47_17815 [Phycisphaerae bacterium]|jgi:hypothetical protein|nr:hypothetical protein [Phycisphaerae bacterium]